MGENRGIGWKKVGTWAGGTSKDRIPKPFSPNFSHLEKGEFLYGKLLLQIDEHKYFAQKDAGQV